MEIEEDIELENLNFFKAEFERATGKSIPERLHVRPKNNINKLSILDGKYEIPMGSLYYPCSGNDIDDAINYFGDTVCKYHFSDPFNPIVRSLSKNLAPKLTDVIKLPKIGNILLHNGASKSTFIKGHHVISYQKDGVLTLLDDIKNMSVFYYRGDSEGEGGSGQNWLSPVLFDLVLCKLMDGGLICTDGSNGNGALHQNLLNLIVGETFIYQHLNIKRLNINLIAKKRPMIVLQVKSEP